MKKSLKAILSVAMVVVLCATVFAGCKKQSDNNNAESTVASSTEASQIEENSTQVSQNTTVQKTMKTRVITAFYAVQGAVIYQTDTDVNGYPDSCQFYKKCESCGYVSNSNGQARGNLTTSYHCVNCGNDQKVEITVDEETVEIPVN